MQPIQRQVVNTDDAPQPLGAYSQAIRVRAGELIYLAGQVGIDRSGNLPGSGDVAAPNPPDLRKPWTGSPRGRCVIQ